MRTAMKIKNFKKTVKGDNLTASNVTGLSQPGTSKRNNEDDTTTK